MMYSDEIEKELHKKGISVGDRIRVGNIEGVLMPKSVGAADTLIIKLDNGYNVGVFYDNSVKKIKEEKFETHEKQKIDKYRKVEGLPTISIITTGGTVASRIDYNTGGVHPLETAEEIASMIPEIFKIANIRLVPMFQMWSEDMEPYHWIKIAERVEQEINETQPDGIIITHGTDTMHYTSSALSMMLQNLPIPVLLIGSQRSSDRGSTDAIMNFLCALSFIAESDFSGVAICMHGSSSDDFCYVHHGMHVRKMHSSRRDAFRSVNTLPYAKISYDGTLEWLRNDYKKKDKGRKTDVAARFEKNVAIVKAYPGFDYKIIENLILSGIRGIVLEGYGLGHIPINSFDDEAKHHKKLLDIIMKYSDKVLFVATTQTVNGVVDLDVYSTGRIEKKAGIIPIQMTAEAAYIKLGWVLGHTKDIEEAKKMMLTNYTGEITERVGYDEY